MAHQHTTETGTLLYAIGDIHGRLDLLQQLHAMIREDIGRQSAQKVIIVYLGDYVDRGPASRGVIEHLISDPMPDCESIYLMGNHEFAMLEFLNHHEETGVWLNWGGKQTLDSYDVHLIDSRGRKKPLYDLAEEARQSISEAHRKFLRHLRYYYRHGDYLFVHAGIDPKKPLENQSKYDLLTIRDRFIYGNEPLPFTVVFGHTVFDTPFRGTNRIGIDTGAFSTGHLTAAILQDDKIRFLTT